MAVTRAAPIVSGTQPPWTILSEEAPKKAMSIARKGMPTSRMETGFHFHSRYATNMARKVSQIMVMVTAIP